MHKFTMPALALLAGAALTAAAAATAGESDAKTYYVGTHVKHTNVTFTSEADLENIYGHSNVASGTVWLDLAEKKGKASVTVPVKNLKTGIELRDEHLRSDKWLDEAKYPDITFATESFDVVEKNKEKGIWEARVKGKFTMHGVTKDIEAPVRIVAVSEESAKVLGAGSWVRVATGFEVKLSDHGVKIPDGPTQGKVNDTWSVKFTCSASTEKAK